MLVFICVFAFYLARGHEAEPREWRGPWQQQRRGGQAYEWTWEGPQEGQGGGGSQVTWQIRALGDTWPKAIVLWQVELINISKLQDRFEIPLLQ